MLSIVRGTKIRQSRRVKSWVPIKSLFNGSCASLVWCRFNQLMRNESPPHFRDATPTQSASNPTLRVVALWALVAVAAVIAGTGMYFWGRESAETTTVEILIPTPAPSIVQISGEVNAPGVYTLNREQRVIDLVDAAGGLTTDADITTLNLAAFLVDGSHVVVRRIAEPDAGQLAEQSTGTQPVQPAQTNRVSSTAGNGPINLNAADAQQLMSLPDIGEVKAALIIELRQQLGAFTSIDQLLDVNGIGPKTLEAIRPLITVQ